MNKDKFIWNTLKGAIRKMGSIRDYKAMPPRERLIFRFQRYLRYYLPYIRERGRLDYQALQLVREAAESLEKCSSESEQKVEQAILAIKQKGIP